MANGTPAEPGLAPRLRFGLDRPLDADDLARLARVLDAGVEIAIAGDGTGYEVVGSTPSPALVAALAAWCADAGRLITWSRTIGGSLEDAYFDLVAAADPQEVR